ncbi:type II secretion system minor pseudopilin GspJ [uncultured Microbulbifer sp.]|uniref:type II secretion system minor pseudopilin GspJ n=1 Tax=uncultured Microbulbifer sp. TaxID=348147 RepID=UPI0026109DAE|nr:type II secretion system minor pseudopilin GspJ [uncultured Microbulbifer sp.]
MKCRPVLARGFTLIEIMVVLVIVSIIGIGSYSLLEIFFSTDRVLNARADEMRRLSMAMYRMDDDLRQLTVRPVKNAYSGYEPAFQGVTNEFEFTRLGAANLTGEPRGNVQRLHYGIGYAEEDSESRFERELDDDTALLIRSRWRILDRGPDSEPIAEPILDGVVELNMRYYDRDTKAWLAQWPPASSASAPGAVDLRLPQAIEVTLLTRGGGEMRRVFSLPDYTVVSATGGSGSGGSSSGGDDDDERDSGSSSSSGGDDRDDNRGEDQ